MSIEHRRTTYAIGHITVISSGAKDVRARTAARLRSAASGELGSDYLRVGRDLVRSSALSFLGRRADQPKMMMAPSATTRINSSTACVLSRVPPEHSAPTLVPISNNWRQLGDSAALSADLASIFRRAPPRSSRFQSVPAPAGRSSRSRRPGGSIGCRRGEGEDGSSRARGPGCRHLARRWRIEVSETTAIIQQRTGADPGPLQPDRTGTDNGRPRA